MNLHLALVHYPIINRTGSVVCSSVTNLDLHDFGRVAMTYGAQRVWIVHPYPAMQRFISKILRHWQDGWGASYNRSRQESISTLQLVSDLLEAREAIEKECGIAPVLVGTSARRTTQTVSFSSFRRKLKENPDTPYLLVFGTGWGLHPEAMEMMDLVLEPIHGPSEWNHLSVRGACAIIMDRLCGKDHPLFEENG